MVRSNNKEDEESLLEVATFVMTCARTSIEEGQRYSPLRFLEVFRKLCDMPQTKDVALLKEIRQAIDKSMNDRLLESDEQRMRFTDEKTRLLMAELKRRSGLS